MLSHACRMFADKMVTQDGEVGTPLPQATASLWKNIETVGEIFAKLFVGNVLPQIAVGGGDVQN